MRLPAIDLGLMAEHLATHEGMINKLELYYGLVSNSILKNVIYSHLYILKSHVWAMLTLIDPNHHGPVHLPKVEEVTLNLTNQTFTEKEKDITLELRSTAKLMSSDNFMSALLMKDKNVSQIHVQMAEQDRKFKSMYNEIIEYLNGDYTPKATEQEQLITLRKYQHVLKE